MRLIQLAVLASMALACGGKAKGPSLFKEWLLQTDEEMGVVAHVGQSSLTIRPAEESGAPRANFSRNGKTLLVRDGERFAWEELAPGTPVRLSYELKGDDPELLRVEVLNGDDGARVAEHVEQMQKTRGAHRTQTP